ncbi:hypothetical protein [Pseudochryseolinea flava]|uniref:hypothetical protein n=1 Tax=Pseudochryseolinea flava TaxID=2059302 RepID=UPI001057ED4A|nr:hypothetical protein [Pseudochryseolinea flava]
MKATLSHRLVLILCFFFVFVTADSKTNESAAVKTTSFQGQEKSVQQPTHRFQLPVKSLPALPGAELPDTNEAEEEPSFDDETSEYWSHAIAHHRDGSLSGRSRLPFTRILENRPTVSLFILHHSWKSYLR